MIPELGHYALILALSVAIVQAVLPLAGVFRRDPGWVAVARPAAQAQFLFLAIAYGALTWTFITNDFSVLYTATNSNSRLPMLYKISGVWGAHEGSLLLWAFILSAWTVAVSLFSRSLPRENVAVVLSVMGMVSVGFLLFTTLTSNPFERIYPVPVDGRDLNPLLQDPGLAFHPPMLYMGYVGFSVAFAFAISALISGRLDAAWARWSRPWTLVAWLFLTLGIMLGSWWAYYELGWGGWWFWDPVENASFMPWLVGTALIHSLAVTEKRGAFKSWTVLLAVFAFSLSLLGTFLVRSGVLTSVHAFASDPTRGVFILIFLAVVVGGSLMLYAWRAPQVRSAVRFGLLSRETMLLVNNVLLVVAAATILLGTIYPLAMDALELGKISVGPPYFDSVFVPVVLPMLILLGIGPNARWKENDPAWLVKRLWVAAVVSVVAGVAAVLVWAGTAPFMTVLSIVLAFWIVAGSVTDIRARIANKPGLVAGLRGLSRSHWGMTVGHLGVAVFMVGVAVSNTWSIEKDVRMGAGDVAKLGEIEYRFEGVTQAEGPNYTSNTGLVRVYRDGREVAVLRPEKRFYHVQTMPMTEAAIDAGFFRDYYVALGEPIPGSDDWPVRLYYKPFIRWIWLGPILMALGGLLSASDRRYRLKRLRESAVSARSPVEGAAAAG